MTTATQLFDDGRLVPQAYYAIVHGIADSLPPVMDETTLSLPARLYRAMVQLHDNPAISRDHRLVLDINELIGRNRDLLSAEFLAAASAILDAYDGQRVRRDIMYGTYMALWHQHLTPGQRVDALRRSCFD